MRRLTSSDQPLRQPDEPVVVSASMLQSLLDCPAKWFLEREAGGERVSTSSQGFGTVVHAIADRLATGDLTADDDVMALVDEVWDQMDFRTPWSRGREREAVAAAIQRFVRWQDSGTRRFLDTEVPVDAEVTLPDGQVVRLHGYADRLEIDADGRVWVVDLKTGKYPPTDKSVADNPQLGLYQLAVDNGAADAIVGAPSVSGGAELVHLRVGDELPKVQAQPPQPEVDGATTVQRQLMQITRAVRDEVLVARPEQTLCSRCAFVPICPAHAAGSVLS